ncbi:MAG: PHP domain-containing protein [Desulfobacterales bacterium]|nr:PHP domain-containing protein [Desulfobacterales bacterium]
MNGSDPTEKYVFRVDLHVHTRRYSQCAELLDPGQLGARIRKRGLYGVVITEHDALWGKSEIESLNEGLGSIKIFRGVEVSTESGHFVVIGLDSMNGIAPGISVKALIEKAKPMEAAVILVHHHLVYSNIQNPIPAAEMPDGIDAIEVASTTTFDEKQADASRIARLRGWTEVAGSDAHALDNVGETFTAFAEPFSSEKELARAIIEGRAFPMRSEDERKRG